jgi:chromate transporter
MPPAPRISLARLLGLFLFIGCTGFGGGMAVIALMERELVARRRLLSTEEFLHGAGLGQILGSFAVNTAFFVGARLFGWMGGLLSAAVFLLPSLTAVIALSALYFRYHAVPALQGAVMGLGPVVIALIAAAAWRLGRKSIRSAPAAAIALAALAAGVMKVNAVWVLLAAGAFGLLLALPDKAEQAPPVDRRPAGPISMAAVIALPGLGTLAATFLQIGFIFFGGGFVLIPVLHQRLVSELHWLNGREFLDGVAISNLTPGPVAVLATFAGFRMAGVAGALTATAALMAPAIVLMVLLTAGYGRFSRKPLARRFLAGLNPAVTGLVLSAAVVLAGGAMSSWRGWVFGAVAFALLAKFDWPPVVPLAAGAIAGLAGLLP